MNREELSFEAYVVLGNALHLLRNGMSPEDQQRLNLPMDELQRLHAALEPVRANDMLATLDRLSPQDRTLLADWTDLCVRLADTQAEHLLGAPVSTCTEIAAALRNAPDGNGVPA